MIHKKNEIDTKWKNDEKHWVKWDDSKILTWFKHKCDDKFFDNQRGNNNNKNNNNDNESLNWNEIENKLKIKQWNGKYLTICDENELRNLGFIDSNVISHLLHCIKTLTSINDTNNKNNQNNENNENNQNTQKKQLQYHHNNQQVKIQHRETEYSESNVIQRNVQESKNKEALTIHNINNCSFDNINENRNGVKRWYDDICDHIYGERLDIIGGGFECGCKSRVLAGVVHYSCIKCGIACCNQCYKTMIDAVGTNEANVNENAMDDSISAPPSKKRRY